MRYLVSGAALRRPEPDWREWVVVGALQASIICLFVATAAQPNMRGLYTAAGCANLIVAAWCVYRGMRRSGLVRDPFWQLLWLRCVWLAAFVPLRNGYIDDHFWWALNGCAGTLVYTVAAAWLVHRRTAGRYRSLWIDIAVICLGASCAMYVWLGAPLLRSFGLSATTVLGAIVTPSLDMLLLGLSLLLVFTARRRNVALELLAAAFILVTFADTAFALAQLDRFGLKVVQSWSPIGPLFMSLIGLAALHPDAALLPRHDIAMRPWNSWRGGWVVAAFSLVLLCDWLAASPQDYVPEWLTPVVLAAMFLLIVVRVWRATQRIAESQRRIAYLAEHDEVTGLANASGLQAAYAQLAPASPRALLLVRISHLHEVGQIHGIPERDVLLHDIAAALSAAADGAGLLARPASDRFALLVVGEQATRPMLDVQAARFVATINAISVQRAERIDCAFDIGIAEAAGDDELNVLLRRAEAATAAAQALGRNRIAHFDADDAVLAQHRLRLLADIRGVIARDELVLHYQPIVAMTTRRLVGHEALLRWRSSKPQGEGSNPLVILAQFGALIEMADAAGEVTGWVVDKACADLAASALRDCAEHRLSINIGAGALQRPGLSERLRAALRRHGLEPARICLELTEHAELHDPHGELVALRELGVKLAIDDFGTGYGNFAMLTRRPFDAVKFDISLVQAIEADASMRNLCRSVVTSLHRSGAIVVAEGIETEAQHAVLRDLGCDRAQGWLYGRPASHLDGVAAA